MQDIDIALIKRKSLSGVVAFTTRTFLLQVIAFFATFLLTIFLTPSIFGLFYIVSAIISFLGYFSDIGLAAALVQKKEEVSREDLVTTFTIQQALVGVLVIAALGVSGPIASFYRLDESGILLYQALVAAFFLSSLKTIPSILLERALDFQKLVIPTIIETVAFYVVAVVLAWRGMGVTSFTWAVLARGLMGLIAMYVIAPWRIGFGFSRSSAKRLLRFGVPFQLNSFLALMKDDLMIVFLGKVLPLSHVGYLGWAKKWAEVPLRLFMDSVIRVTFPAFSRIQHDAKLMASALEKTLFGLAATIFPITIGLVFFIKPLVAIIPKYGKWEPAILAFYFFAFAAAIAGFSTPLTNAFNAVGKIKITLGLMIFWTASTWALTVWLINLFGFNGYAIAVFIVSLSIFGVVYIMKQVTPFRFLSSIGVPLIGALIQSIWYVYLRGVPPFTLARLMWVGGSGVILYAGFVWVFERKRIMSLIPKKQS